MTIGILRKCSLLLKNLIDFDRRRRGNQAVATKTQEIAPIFSVTLVMWCSLIATLSPQKLKFTKT